MGRVLLSLSLLLLSASILCGLLALRAWNQSDDVWGLLYGMMSLSAGLSAQRIFEPTSKEEG